MAEEIDYSILYSLLYNQKISTISFISFILLVTSIFIEIEVKFYKLGTTNVNYITLLQNYKKSSFILNNYFHSLIFIKKELKDNIWKDY